ncbi:hypothetical protein M6B38_390785 [Iris pallida]|uniref:Uncharacterized protein n=1 Tax=Iris pallida TaxID=29817 RepID=A0AAX6FZR7_IRIPA|nr:hypothetical protein M6B38_390785 [Iris pallida]
MVVFFHNQDVDCINSLQQFIAASVRIRESTVDFISRTFFES